MAAAGWPGPHDIRRTRLDNGITLLARENRSAPVVVMEGILAVGAIADPDERLGLSSFTANLLSRGSEHYSYEAFNEAIESIGASLSFSSDSDSLSVGVTCLSEDFPILVEVMSDALRRPTFDQGQFDLVRRRKLVHLQERDQDTSAVASLRFYEAVYGGHPLGRPVSGHLETVAAIERADVERFHADHYGPAGAVFAVSGDVDALAAFELLHRRLGDWAARPLPQMSPPVTEQTAPARQHFPIAEKVQADIVLGVQAVGRNHPDYYAIRVANTILGVFGMMGRLGEVVREQQGLAYYAYSSQEALRDSGVWIASAGVSPSQLDRALESMLAEVNRLAAEAVSEEELSDSKAYLTGVLPLALETNDGIAATLGNIEWFELGLDFLSRYASLIEAVTVEDIQRVARAYLRPEAIAIVTAGS